MEHETNTGFVHISDTETVSKTKNADDVNVQGVGNNLNSRHSGPPSIHNSVDQANTGAVPDRSSVGNPIGSSVAENAPQPAQPVFQFPYGQHSMQTTHGFATPHSNDLLQFYEIQMRNHAAAFANAAASAAMVSAQIAADMAQASNTTRNGNGNSMPPLVLPSPAACHHPIFPMPIIQQPYVQALPCYEHSSRPVSEVAAYNNLDANSSLGEDCSSDYGQRRRKRQQRMPPESRNNQVNQVSRETEHPSSSGKRGRRRRRLRNDYSQQYDNQNRRRNRKIALASSSSDGGSTSYVSKKKQRQPSDESLLGKTGVSALYEWCGKRKTTPTFALGSTVEDFEMTVSIDATLWGKGKGKNKLVAKQEAARRALQALVPGVVFDEGGTLIQLPNQTTSRFREQSQSTTTAASLEELAPNLAKRLAIVHHDDDEVEARKGNPRPVSETKRRHNLTHFYPGTSTTSEEENENDYLSSRGASVCSALLHAMVQIDERIPESPSYTYQVSTVPASSKGSTQMKRKADGPLPSPIVVHRGSFTCTATLRVQIKASEPGQPTFEILQANGVGGTKREARHTASAQLLAKLFPECKGMVAVKHAAECEREKYARLKALKQQSKRERVFADGSINLSGRSRIGEKIPKMSFAMSSPKSPGLPKNVEERLMTALVAAASATDMTASSIPHKEDGDDSDLVRQHSRHKQLDEAIASALQKLNELDEDGRSLPGELSVDDVGRTVLRRASQEDMVWITKLLETEEASLSPVSVFLRREYQNNPDDLSNECSSLAHRLWSSFTLLLCRAIAPYEEPLGCAVLTLGFSLQRGRSLRIAQIASKSHLPLERFTEVLQTFAHHMACTLETTAMNSPSTKFGRDDIHKIINSHLPIPGGILDSCSKGSLSSPEHEEPLASLSALQSVKEEDSECDDDSESAADKRNAKKAQVKKPSKRSRVQ